MPGKIKLLMIFSLFGFLLGAVTYVVFDFLFLSSPLGLQPVSILRTISAPWFISGIAGSILSVITVYASAHFSGDV